MPSPRLKDEGSKSPLPHVVAFTWGLEGKGGVIPSLSLSILRHTLYIPYYRSRWFEGITPEGSTKPPHAMEMVPSLLPMTKF